MSEKPEKAPRTAGAPRVKPELTDADKALLEAEPDWERMGQGAKRLLHSKPDRQSVVKATAPKVGG